MEFEERGNLADVVIPDPLRREEAMVLHTEAAVKLFAGSQQDGDKDYSINNLKKFSKKTNLIYFAAQNDDPFADWCLYRIEQEMGEIESLMSGEKGRLEALLKCVDSVQIMPAVSVKPVNITLRFANPFPYRAANMIAQYDELARLAWTANHVGLMGSEARNAYIIPRADRIKELYMMASKWKPNRVRRDTYDPAKADTREAEAAMGILPKEFLEGSLRAKNSPDIRKA